MTKYLLAWLGLTVAFEFLFGHYAMGHTWSRLLQDYKLLEGRVWVLLLIWVTMAPLLFIACNAPERMVPMRT